jgi:hypothetical protein
MSSRGPGVRDTPDQLVGGQLIVRRSKQVRTPLRSQQRHLPQHCRYRVGSYFYLMKVRDVTILAINLDVTDPRNLADGDGEPSA